jgi:threonylcarbamoyladenosine tRNA methylthiotransferase MtaB
MPQLPVPLRRERAARLRAAGQSSAARFYATRLEAARSGGEEAVLFEREDRGHTAHFAPLRLLGASAAPGELRLVRVTGADAEGLLAEVAPSPERMGQS